MSDPRELIMARLMAICDGLTGLRAVYRNRSTIAEDARPCIVVLDGDETADEADRNRHGMAPRRVTMLPALYVLASDDAEAIGSSLNEWRAKAIAAVQSDVTLAALTHDNKGPAYMGAQIAMENGRRVEGAIELTFALTYILRPADLADAGSSGS